MTESRRAALDRAAARLRAAGIDSPRLEARLLLAHALGITPEALVAAQDAPSTEAFGALVERRAAREPLAFILGYREFWSLRFAVSPATLIPRPETETIVAAALAGPAARRVLDLGTGTGCLLLSLLHEWPAAWGVGVDRVPAACALAAANGRALALSSRAAFVCGDWGSALHGRFDLVVSNPPYIVCSDLPRLMPDVAAHEAASALDGGEDGLACYRAILPELDRLLAPDGRAILEFGAGQGPAVADLAKAHGLHPGMEKDLSGMMRILVLQRGGRDEKTFGSAGRGR